MEAAPVLIGVDVGGTNLRVGIVQANELLWESNTNADFSGLFNLYSSEIALEKMIQILADNIKKALDVYPAVIGIGIGFPGFIDPKNHHIIQSPNMPGLSDINLKDSLSEILGKPVIIENDALAAAYGEFVLNDITQKNLLYVCLGTGVGGGLILNGDPYSGQNGFAMEIGHVNVEQNGRLCGCGNFGCLEQYASAKGIVKTYVELGGEVGLDAKEIAIKANSNNIEAIQAYELAGKYLGVVLANASNLLDVNAIIIGGGASQAWPLLKPAINISLNQNLIPVLKNRISVKESKHLDLSGIVGAALLHTHKQDRING